MRGLRAEAEVSEVGMVLLQYLRNGDAHFPLLCLFSAAPRAGGVVSPDS
jgi:hypothetical protein